MGLKYYLTLLQTLVKLDNDLFSIILPYLESNVREVIYLCIYNVIYHSKGRINQDLRHQLHDLIEDKRDELEILATKHGNKLQKRRMLRSLGPELRLILSAAIPLIIMSK